MIVHGHTSGGAIAATMDGVLVSVPDDMRNRDRQRIAEEWEAQGNVIPPYVPSPPSPEEVDVERDGRIAAGFAFGGVFYQTRPEDRENIAGASTAALAAMVAGALPGDLRWHGNDNDFAWIAADNSLHPMDAQTMFAFGQAAMAHKQAHIFAARALKDIDPIPADFADAAYWPVPAAP